MPVRTFLFRLTHPMIPAMTQLKAHQQVVNIPCHYVFINIHDKREIKLWH